MDDHRELIGRPVRREHRYRTSDPTGRVGCQVSEVLGATVRPAGWGDALVVGPLQPLEG